MIDFKAELSKFQPLPEFHDENNKADTVVKDIMDILSDLKKDR